MEFVSNFVKTKYGDTLVECKFKNKKGYSIEKVLHIDDYINMLTGSLTVKKQEAPLTRIGELPKSFYDGAVSSDGKVAAVLVYPGQKWYFRRAGQKKGEYVAFPPLVFAFATSANGRITKSYCFSSKTAEVRQNTKLCLYPYGNVSHIGNICWGNGAQYLHDISTIAQLEHAVEVFFSAGTAPHYYSGSVNTSLGLSHDELIDKMAEATEFPIETLRDADITVGELMEKLLIN